MGRIAVALVALMALAGIEPARSGDLWCVGASTVIARSPSAQCTAAGAGLGITATDVSRPFVRVEAAGKEIILGEWPAGAVRPPADAAGSRVRLPVSMSATETIDGNCALAVSPLDDAGRSSSGETPRWAVEVPGKDLLVKRGLSFPRGHYAVAVDCGVNFSSEPIVVDARQGTEVALSAIEVRVVSLPRITGRIAPVEAAGVAVLHDDQGRFLGRAEPDGSFRIVVAPDRWPGRVVVSASSYGSVVLPLPPAPATLELPGVELKKAGRIVLSIPPGQRDDVESVEVVQLRGKRERAPYRTITRAALSESEFKIEVAPGKYVLVVRGDQPLERFGATVELAAGEEREVIVPLTGEEVDVRTFLGERRLGDAEVTMESVDGQWNTNFRTSPDGSMTSHLWQPGNVVFILQSKEVAGHSGTLELRAPGVDMRVPGRSVEGKVVDAVTDQPIADVNVALSSGQGSSMTKSAADGSFKFVGVKPGAYRLSAGGANGLSQETISVQVMQDEIGLKRLRLALRPTQELELEIVSSDGQPARGAAVFELSGPTVLSLREADEAGTVRMPAFSSVPRAVIAIANDGRLYAQTLSREAPSKVRMIIPPATSSIAIMIGTEKERRPIPGVSLVMRLNGVLFPVDAMQLMYVRTGIRLTSDESGQVRLPRVPAGLYEFWAIRSRSDLEAVLSGQLQAAPVVIAAGPGENRATLGFLSAR
ncbi:MAG TPA: carboxypeptidase-like regulatory domain-containing protein [Thermoanaerobaculia bacterium]|jgi:hypothetical protein